MKKIMFSERYGLTDAVLTGRKTMTRRVIKGDFEDIKAYHANGEWHFIADTKDGDCVEVKTAYEIGEKVAIAQAYSNLREVLAKRDFKRTDALYDNFYRALQMGEAHDGMPGWCNKMFVKAEYMPHSISITATKLERLQDISDEDCLREGVEKWMDCYIVTGILKRGQKRNVCFDTPREAFAALIDRISGKGTWQRNPWVFAYTFKLLQ